MPTSEVSGSRYCNPLSTTETRRIIVARSTWNYPPAWPRSRAPPVTHRAIHKYVHYVRRIYVCTARSFLQREGRVKLHASSYVPRGHATNSRVYRLVDAWRGFCVQYFSSLYRAHPRPVSRRLGWQETRATSSRYDTSGQIVVHSSVRDLMVVYIIIILLCLLCHAAQASVGDHLSWRSAPPRLFRGLFFLSTPSVPSCNSSVLSLNFKSIYMYMYKPTLWT